MQDPTVWQTRWQALTTTLDEMITSYQTLANPTFGALATCLKAFGHDQFEFFLTGFDTNRLLPSPQYPPDSIYRATLDQVSYDITAVQQAVDQRQDGFPTMKTALEKADALSQNALNLGSHQNKLIRPASVISYFIKGANIRVIPYAPVAVVGVPYTCFTTNRDYLAIPHEIGHYMYHHGTGIASDLHLLLSAMPEWGEHWLEEIFADVYGCFVAGPVIGLDFEDLISDNNQQRFTSSDGHHPVDAIRPYIYTAVLKELGFVNASLALTVRWEEILKERGNPQSISLGDGFGEIPISEGKAFVEETAVSILNYLRNEKQIPTDKTWTKDLTTPQTNVEELYSAFEAILPQLTTTPCNTLQLEETENKVFVVLPSGNKKNKRAVGSTQTWRDWFKTQSRAHEKDKLPAEAWMPIFTALHWPIKGPETNGASGSP